MVHVANAEGHRKMLAFQPPPLPASPSNSANSTPPKNLSHILIDTISKKFGGISDSEKVPEEPSSSTVTLKTNHKNFLPTYKSNSLNLSCVIEEEPPPGMMNTTIRDATDDSNANFSDMTSDPNLNSNYEVVSTVRSTVREGLDGRVVETSTVCTTTKLSKKRSASPTFSQEKVIQSGPLTESSPSVSAGALSGPLVGALDQVGPCEGPPECVQGGESSDICFHSSQNDENDFLSNKNFTSIPNDSVKNGGESRRDEASPPHSSISQGKQGKSINGTKNVCLKRVSFGSSKGSMVETVIFESSQPDEISRTPLGTPTSEIATIGESPENAESPETATGSTGGSRPPSRVRVTFFESEKPLAVSSPDSDPLDLDLSTMTQPSPLDTSTPNNYSRHLSVESGWENPFRPDGDLSKEADQIVELIKEGKPINDETLRSISPSVNENEMMHSSNYTNNLTASPPLQQGKGTNGSANGMEVQRGVVVPPSQTGAVEHVTLKKKKGCCVIQ